MTNYTGRAIVTYGRSLMSLVIAHSLAQRGIEVISCDSVGMTATSFSKYTTDKFIHADENSDEDGYIADMVSFASKYKPADNRPYVLIPAFRDAKILARHRDKFEGIITIAAASFEVMDKVDPKHHLMKTLEDLNIAAPRTWHPQTKLELEEALQEIKQPALIKAVDEVGGRGIDFTHKHQELWELSKKRMATENPPPILQEAVDGEDYCLGVIYHNGQLKAHMAYKNLQNMPSDGGAGAMRQTVDDAPFLKAANTLMSAINWTGIAEIDFRWTGRAEDKPYLIEVNPRFWAGIFQSVESGIDFPWLLYHLYAFGSVPYAGEADTTTKTRLPGLWVAGAIKDAFSTDADMDGAKADWTEMVSEMKDGDFGMAFDSLKSAFIKVTNFDDAVALLQRQSRHASEAKSEIPIADDPMASLGVFFVLSSLLRHGKLPDEMTR